MDKRRILNLQNNTSLLRNLTIMANIQQTASIYEHFLVNNPLRYFLITSHRNGTVWPTVFANTKHVLDGPIMQTIYKHLRLKGLGDRPSFQSFTNSDKQCNNDPRASYRFEGKYYFMQWLSISIYYIQQGVALWLTDFFVSSFTCQFLECSAIFLDKCLNGGKRISGISFQ